MHLVQATTQRPYTFHTRYWLIRFIGIVETAVVTSYWYRYARRGSSKIIVRTVIVFMRRLAVLLWPTVVRFLHFGNANNTRGFAPPPSRCSRRVRSGTRLINCRAVGLAVRKAPPSILHPLVPCLFGLSRE